MFWEIVIILFFLAWLFPRYPRMFFGWLLQKVGQRIFKKAILRQQEAMQRQAAAQQRQQQGFQSDAYEQGDITIMVPNKKKNKPGSQEGEYVDFEEID